LLFKGLNETNDKIPTLNELLKVFAAKQTLIGEKGGSCI
jgi:hypothetical protein